jgi:hypothetical protein
LPEEIYLIPESDEEFGDYWAWCDTPDPTNDHIKEEALKYVKESIMLAEQAKNLSLSKQIVDLNRKLSEMDAFSPPVGFTITANDMREHFGDDE